MGTRSQATRYAAVERDATGIILTSKVRLRNTSPDIAVIRGIINLVIFLGGALPVPRGGALPAPRGGALPARLGGALPAPRGDALPAPRGDALPAPRGGALPAPRVGRYLHPCVGRYLQYGWSHYLQKVAHNFRFPGLDIPSCCFILI